MLENVTLPPWHLRDPSQLNSAIKIALENAPHLEPLITTLLPKMPRLNRASYDLKTLSPASGLCTLASIITAPWISFDSNIARNVLLLDIDHEEGDLLAMELPPQIRPHIVIDPWSGRSAGIVVLKTPVLTGPGSRPAPQKLAEIAHGLLETYFRANDHCPQGNMAKNPFGLVSSVQGKLRRRSDDPLTLDLWEGWQASGSRLIWQTIMGAQEVELRDIIRVLGTDEPASRTNIRKRHRAMPDFSGRNHEIFTRTRLWAYDHVCREFVAILQKAQEVNASFPVPLGGVEVAGIARSIHKYMQNDKHGRRINGGVMDLAASGFTLHQKRILSAARTNDLRIEATDTALLDAVKQWPRGVKMTQKSLAAAADVSLKTVKRRWSKLPKP